MTETLSDMVLGTIDLERCVSKGEIGLCHVDPKGTDYVSINLFTFPPEIKTHERPIGVEERWVSVCR